MKSENATKAPAANTADLSMLQGFLSNVNAVPLALDIWQNTMVVRESLLYRKQPLSPEETAFAALHDRITAAFDRVELEAPYSYHILLERHIWETPIKQLCENRNKQPGDILAALRKGYQIFLASYTALSPSPAISPAAKAGEEAAVAASGGVVKKRGAHEPLITSVPVSWAVNEAGEVVGYAE